MKTKEISFYTHIELVFLSIIVFAAFFYIAIGINKWLFELFISRIQTGLIIAFITGVIILIFTPIMVKNKEKESHYPSSISFIAFLDLFIIIEVKDLTGFLIAVSAFIIAVFINTLFFYPGNIKEFMLYSTRSLFQGSFIILFATTLIRLSPELIAMSSIIGFILLVDYLNAKFISKSI